MNAAPRVAPVPTDELLRALFEEDVAAIDAAAAVLAAAGEHDLADALVARLPGAREATADPAPFPYGGALTVAAHALVASRWTEADAALDEAARAASRRPTTSAEPILEVMAFVMEHRSVLPPDVKRSLAKWALDQDEPALRFELETWEPDKRADVAAVRAALASHPRFAPLARSLPKRLLPAGMTGGEGWIFGAIALGLLATLVVPRLVPALGPPPPPPARATPSSSSTNTAPSAPPSSSAPPVAAPHDEVDVAADDGRDRSMVVAMVWLASCATTADERRAVMLAAYAYEAGCPTLRAEAAALAALLTREGRHCTNGLGALEQSTQERCALGEADP